jgi:hypothetical protein
MLDIAIAYNRYRFLGNEYLTWLWFTLENERKRLNQFDKDLTSLEIGNRMVLENRHSESLETITIRGDEAGLEEGILALKKGALVNDINLLYHCGDQTWQFNLKGESLNISSLKTPKSGMVEKKEDIEGSVLEKIYLYNKIVEFVERSFQNFIQIRLSDSWEKIEVPKIKKWLIKEK